MLTFKEACALINTPDRETFELLVEANKICQKHKGNKIKLCAIVNAKSGRCSENCNFCAQSAYYKTDIKTYPLLSLEEIVSAAKKSEKNMSATCFSIVTSGKATQIETETKTIRKALEAITTQTNLKRCVSLGTLQKDALTKLKDAGLKRLHHNLETARSFFNHICTTHTYDERLQTIKFAKEVGLEVCSGGIFGLGETSKQRVELAFALKELDVESVPINILNPIPGTKAAENYRAMSPLEVLRLIATYRMILPEKDIGLFGGREISLRDLQPLVFIAGANVTMVGDYLTTKGQSAQKDLQMIRDLGLEIEKNPRSPISDKQDKNMCPAGP